MSQSQGGGGGFPPRSAGRVQISGMSGNELFCLQEKGLTPGEISVGNSVYSLGVGGAVASMGRAFAGGEITQVTSMISDGRHQAISRMEEEARRHGAVGVTGVDTKLGRLAGFTEFFSQGTGVYSERPEFAGRFFSSAASGIELYNHLDAGYWPVRFVMGNIAYAIGVGRGLLGTMRTLARGEVREFSSMYNEIRHTALQRLRIEAAQNGANAVADVRVQMLPYGPGTVELLLTGTASFHRAFSPGAVTEQQVITSEMTGEELWNLAQMGYAPHQIVMATSVYALGVASGLGAMFRAIQRRELPEVTKMIYEARENCLDLVRQEAEALGADRVIGNRLQVREISQGLIEVVALGTAVKRVDGIRPETEKMIPQAVIVDAQSRGDGSSIQTLSFGVGAGVMQQYKGAAMRGGGGQLIGCLIAVFMFMLMACGGIFAAMQEGGRRGDVSPERLDEEGIAAEFHQEAGTVISDGVDGLVTRLWAEANLGG